MKHFRLFTKVLALLVLLFGITTLTTAIISARILERNLTEQYESKGMAIACSVAEASVHPMLFRDAASIQAMIEQYLEDGQIQGVSYIFVVNEGKQIISHTFSPGIPEEVNRFQDDPARSTIQQLTIAGQGDFIDISAPILSSELGHVHVGMDRKLIGQAIGVALARQLVLMGLLFFLSIVAAYFLVRRLARPLKHLAHFAKRVAVQDVAGLGTDEARAELRSMVAGKDEVGQLAQAFEHMVSEITSREQSLRRTQAELQAFNETLEQRAQERSAAAEQRAEELARANEHLQREMAERRQAEAKLDQERFLMNMLMEHIPDYIYFKDSASRFIRVNRYQTQHLRLGRPEDAYGKTDFDFFPQEQARQYFADEQEVMRTGEPLVGREEKATWTAGPEKWVLTTKLPLYDKDRKIIGTFGISRDITLRKKAQIALEVSERRYRQLTEASPDAIVVADKNQRIQLVNPAAERFFGYTAAELLGQLLPCLMPQEFCQRHQEGFQNILTTREAHFMGRPMELRGRRKDGSEFPLELSLSVVDLGDDFQFIGTMRDLTERNRMQAMVAKTEKLASIGQLSAGVAHEINNPLAFVANNLAVLERDVKGLMTLVNLYDGAQDRLAQVDAALGNQARDLTEQIDLPYLRDNMDRLLSRTRDGVQRVTQIVHSLRSLARTDPHELVETQVAEMVNTSLEMIRGQLRRRSIQVDIAYDATVPSLKCVPTQITQVLLNMVVNAMQAIENTHVEQGSIRIATRSLDGEMCIEIADNGCGIDPKNLSRLFDPFFTTKPVGEGTGLGLSIAHNIITGHGGRIEVTSQPGTGTTFLIYLPISPKTKKK